MKTKLIYLHQRPSFRDKVSEMLVNTFKPLYFFLRKRKEPWKVTMEQLDALPDSTLGKDVSNFLKANGLTIMPRAEVHDVYHVLFGYSTLMKEETCIQFVPLGNGRWSAPYVASTFVAAIFYPEYWGDFYEAYKCGKTANRFHDWDFETLLHKPTQEVRKMMFEK